MRIYVISLKRIYRKICLALILASIILTGLGVAFLPTIKAEETEIAASNDSVSKRVIIIDAGHGGEDPGAIGVNGIYEKDLNLALALEIGNMLSEKGCTVVYTRTEDKMLYSQEENIKGMRKISDLKNRCLVTQNYENPILISIHMNTYGASKYSGLQVYYQNGSNESTALAKSIQTSVKETVQPQNTRSIKNGENLYLLQNANGTGVIIECGFLSNNEECEKLSEKEYQKQLSFSIVCGIINYMNKTNDSN